MIKYCFGPLCAHLLSMHDKICLIFFYQKSLPAKFQNVVKIFLESLRGQTSSYDDNAIFEYHKQAA